MHGCTWRSFAAVLALAVVYGGSSLAWSQESHLTSGPGGPAYSPPPGPGESASDVAPLPAGDQFVSPAAFGTQPPGALDSQRPDWFSRGWAADVERRLRRIAREEEREA